MEASAGPERPYLAKHWQAGDGTVSSDGSQTLTDRLNRAEMRQVHAAARREAMKKSRPYLDRGRPGTPRHDEHGNLVTMTAEVPSAPDRKLTLESLRRHNSLDPELQDTHRVLLRWSETAGTGEFNPEADKREIHYDPLPLEVQEQVSAIIKGSPWSFFVRKLYFTTLTMGSLADQLGISTALLKTERKNCLWYFKGHFEAQKVSVLATPKRLRLRDWLR
jgi:hypothetical protein